ncbi:MAG: DUF481 domain-containing protein [Burkholderiaceae bacterium]
MTLRSHAFAGAVLCAFMATPVLAQIKTDGQWRGSGGASLAVSSGNTRSNALLLSAEASRASTADKISLSGTANYAKSTNAGVDQTTANKWGGALQYDYNLTTRIYTFGKLGLEGDRIVDLSLRSSLAGGLGYHLIDTPQTTLDVFGGAAYTTDKYRVVKTIGDATDTRFARASLLFGEESTHELTSTVSAKQRLDVFPGLSGDKAVLMKFNAGLSVAMSSTLNLTVGLVDNYNSKPPAGQKKNDVGLFTGVNMKFGAL